MTSREGHDAPSSHRTTEPAGHVGPAGPARGYRVLGHTADLAIEAWAPSRAGCLAEAVHGMVSSFLDVSDAREPEGGAGGEATQRTGSEATGEEVLTLHFAPDCDEDLLVAVLEEVIYLVEVHERVPVNARADDRADGGVTVGLVTTATDAVALVGAVPKAVTRHELRFGRSGEEWRCHVTIDV